MKSVVDEKESSDSGGQIPHAENVEATDSVNVVNSPSLVEALQRDLYAGGPNKTIRPRRMAPGLHR